MSKAPVQMIRKPELLKLIGLSGGTIYRLMSKGQFPRPLKVTGYSVAWRSDEVAERQDNLKTSYGPAS